MTRKTSVRLVLKLLVILASISSIYGSMGPICSELKKVEVHHKTYFDIYLGLRYRSYSGIFYFMINEAVKQCCPTSSVTFLPVEDKDRTIEEILVETVKADRKRGEDGILKLFYPEFADKSTLDIYDSTTPFLRLSKSPGPAIVMVKPEPKKPVFVGEIVVKSWAILIFLITFAWVVGILAWMADHRVNPKHFPNPFYIGMFEGFWWSVVTMTTVGYGDKAPKGIIARILTVFWIMISTVFLALFTANATSILAISQAEEDHSITLGKRVGVLNSKHFVEVELNLGATFTEYDSTFEWTMAATQNSDVDRLMFPNYMDFLLFVKDETYQALLKSEFVLTNAVRYPFQIGMALAAEAHNMTDLKDSFLECMRLELPTLERQARKSLDYSVIEFTEHAKTKKLKTPLDGDNLLMMTYYFFGLIALLVSVGLGWDFWVYWTKVRPARRRGTDQADVTEANDDAHAEFVDVGDIAEPESSTFAQEQNDDHADKKYKMSIAE